ncbi:hypothetical protein [Kitasatospora sp. NPDC050543]|uniref:hypothetical protein n=1 Tax=Kitasatospora sp. NPDC050543 TaxID=3364054 RepID=UPI0037B108ED
MTMCLYSYSDRSGGYMHWSVDRSGARTDERMYFTLQGGGGACSASGNWNDYQSTEGYIYTYCGTPLRGISYSTESGKNSSNGTHTTAWLY